MNKRKNNTSPLKIAVLGHKTIPSRQGGIEIVVEELTVRMAKLGHKITVYNRNGHSSDVEQVLMQEETILDEEIILEIQRMAENWLQRIINKLHTHVTDFRTNPAVFLGGGSLLLRKQIENSPEFKYVEFIDDVRANAIGYEKLTTARLRRG